jgi:hypothetical protein
MRVYIIYGDEFAERVVGNLCNLSTFCQACSLACSYCRSTYGSFAQDIYGIYKLPENLPTFIDEPEKYLPESLPNCDLILAIGMQPDLLSAIPTIVERTKAKGVIVPIENRNWCPRGLKRQLEDKLEEAGIEHAFPKPFCSLKETGRPVIDGFIRRYKIGKPLVEVDITDGMISDAWVVRSAPCGSTWYVVQQIKKCRISKIEDTVAVAHHSYPCTASMDIDPELNEPILHVAGYNIREAVKDAIERAREQRKLET